MVSKKTDSDEMVNEQPKQMSNAEVWLKMLADQKFIREVRQKGISYQELREKYGFKFKIIV